MVKCPVSVTAEETQVFYWASKCRSGIKTASWHKYSMPSCVFSVALQTKGGLGRLVFMFLDHTQLDTHTHAHTLWTSDQLFSEAGTHTTHNKYNRRTSMPSTGFEPASPAIKRTQTFVLEPLATGIGQDKLYLRNFKADCYLILWCCSVYSLNSLLLNWHSSIKIYPASSLVCHRSFARW
jgi:hypothetical protein